MVPTGMVPYQLVIKCAVRQKCVMTCPDQFQRFSHLYIMEESSLVEKMGPRRGRYKSSSLVRGLRLTRLKNTTMSITASLDKRQAVQLGETILPVPTVYGRAGGQFSDITRLLSGGPGPTGASGSSPGDNESGPGSPGGGSGGGVSSGGSTMSNLGAVNKKKGSSAVGSLMTASASIVEVTNPKDIEDDRQVSLMLDTQRRKSGRVGRANANKELGIFESSFTSVSKKEWRLRCTAEVVRITRKLRSKCDGT